MLKKIVISAIFYFLIHDMAAQLGAPVYMQNFGRGNGDINSVGPPLSAGVTTFSYSTDLCPPPGSYVLARRISIAGCFNNEWIPLSRDDNFDMDFGNMMIVNNPPSTVNRIVYKDIVDKALCPGVTYHFGFSVINLDRPAPSCVNGTQFPVFKFRIETDAGVLIKEEFTQPVLYASPDPKYEFYKYNLDFVMPAGVNRIGLSITLYSLTDACADDFAIDRIFVAPVGPVARIGFVNEPTTLVKSVCFQDNVSVSLSGTVDPYYPNPVLQWQQSTDGGVIWTDIPGANGNTYTGNFPVADTFLFRLSAGDASNVVNPNCRVVSNIMQLNVDGPPIYTISNNSPVCAGQDLQFLGQGGVFYTWWGPNGFYDNISTPHIFNSTLADSGMYYVEVVSLGGCKALDSTRAIIIGTDVQAGPDTVICSGRQVRLQASDGINYEWTPAVGLSSASVRNPLAKPTISTEYTVKVTDTYGCSDTAKLFIRVVNEIPVRSVIEGSNYLCRVYDSVLFKDRSEGAISSRRWEFGNGQWDTTSHPPVQFYNTSGSASSYVARLAIADTAGCTDTAYHFLNVVGNCYIAVPSGFTPNGDGLNDYLSPLNAYKATDLQFRVFNRTGQVVFETRDWTRKWDGTVGGVKQDGGVYVWLLVYTDAGGRRISLKGTTVLIR